MPTYITLGQWTPQGVKDVKDSPNRIARARRMFYDAGAEVKGVYMTMGQYDIVALCEAPDDETMARLMLTLSRTGNVRFETLKAFTEKEHLKIIATIAS
jgi:uncharacterized protein with GYD domain